MIAVAVVTGLRLPDNNVEQGLHLFVYPVESLGEAEAMGLVDALAACPEGWSVWMSKGLRIEPEIRIVEQPLWPTKDKYEWVMGEVDGEPALVAVEREPIVIEVASAETELGDEPADEQAAKGGG